MQLEVTKKEALEIYAQRFSQSKSKMRRFLPGIMMLVALIIGTTLIFFEYNGLGIIIFLAIAVPSYLFSMLDYRASNKYARQQVKGEV